MKGNKQKRTQSSSVDYKEIKKSRQSVRWCRRDPQSPGHQWLRRLRPWCSRSPSLFPSLPPSDPPTSGLFCVHSPGAVPFGRPIQRSSKYQYQNQCQLFRVLTSQLLAGTQVVFSFKYSGYSQVLGHFQLYVLHVMAITQVISSF